LKYAKEEIFKLRNKNKESKRELNHELEEIEKMIVILKEELDKSKKTGELMKHKLKKNIEYYEELKVELDHIRKESMLTITKVNDIMNFERSIEKLDEIISK